MFSERIDSTFHSHTIYFSKNLYYPLSLGQIPFLSRVCSLFPVILSWIANNSLPLVLCHSMCHICSYIFLLRWRRFSFLMLIQSPTTIFINSIVFIYCRFDTPNPPCFFIRVSIFIYCLFIYCRFDTCSISPNYITSSSIPHVPIKVFFFFFSLILSYLYCHLSK